MNYPGIYRQKQSPEFPKPSDYGTLPRKSADDNVIQNFESGSPYKGDFSFSKHDAAMKSGPQIITMQMENMPK